MEKIQWYKATVQSVNYKCSKPFFMFLMPAMDGCTHSAFLDDLPPRIQDELKPGMNIDVYCWNKDNCLYSIGVGTKSFTFLTKWYDEWAISWALVEKM